MYAQRSYDKKGEREHTNKKGKANQNTQLKVRSGQAYKMKVGENASIIDHPPFLSG